MTRQGCQNRKCTYDRGWVEWAQLWHPQEEGDVELLYNSVKTGSQFSLETRPVGDKMRKRKQASSRVGPQVTGWAVQENGKETRLWPTEWGSICCSSVRSPTPSHTQPFQIKWEVYFSKELCRSSSLCCYVLHAYVDYVLRVCIVGHGCDYTTVGCWLIWDIYQCSRWMLLYFYQI